MDVKQISDIIKEEIKYKDTSEHDFKYSLLAKTVKLGEEVGELNEQILGVLNMQRTDKDSEYNYKNIEDEIADIIIVAVHLSVYMDMDINKILQNKIEKIQNRNA